MYCVENAAEVLKKHENASPQQRYAWLIFALKTCKVHVRLIFALKACKVQDFKFSSRLILMGKPWNHIVQGYQ